MALVSGSDENVRGGAGKDFASMVRKFGGMKIPCESHQVKIPVKTNCPSELDLPIRLDYQQKHSGLDVSSSVGVAIRTTRSSGALDDEVYVVLEELKYELIGNYRRIAFILVN
jgi:hypothetical protein